MLTLAINCCCRLILDSTGTGETVCWQRPCIGTFLLRLWVWTARVQVGSAQTRWVEVCNIYTIHLVLNLRASKQIQHIREPHVVNKCIRREWQSLGGFAATGTCRRYCSDRRFRFIYDDIVHLLTLMVLHKPTNHPDMNLCAGVGKTSFLKLFTHGEFSRCHPTTGYAMSAKIFSAYRNLQICVF